MRLGSAGLLALLWSLSSGSNIATASPLADDAKAMPGLRPRQGSGTGSTPTSTTPVASTPTTSAAAEQTTTITDTVTVGGGSGGTVTVTSNFLRTVITTVVVTTTTFETTTVTSNDVATATLTEYVTSTILAKRWINFLPAETAPVDAPAAQITPAAGPGPDLRKHAVIEKRAIVTVTVTVTGAAGADATVTNVRTSTVVRTTTSNLVQTSTIVSTLFNNAQTTITVTSTLLVTSTSVDTTSAATVDTGPTTGNIATATDSGGSSATGSSDSSSGDGGLSTGAKAGIGAGVGVVGLALLLGIGWWLYKRHKANRPSAADLADMRAYDPNGPSYDNGHGMSETGAGLGAAAATTPTHRRQPVPRKSSQLSPPTQSVSPMSNQTVSPANDYGSGYTRPANGANELGGTRILPPEMGGDEVVEMGDGQPKPQPPPQQRQHMTAFQSGPVPDVYEMPTERYR